MNTKRWLVTLALTILPLAAAQTTPAQTSPATPAKSAQAAPSNAAPSSPAQTPSTPAATPSTPETRAALARGRQLLTDFYAVRLDALWQSFTPDVKAQWGTLANFRSFRQTGVTQYGAQAQLVRERTFTDQGVTYYVRSATFEKAPKQVWALIIGFEKGGRISTFGIVLEEDRTDDQQARGPSNRLTV